MCRNFPCNRGEEASALWDDVRSSNGTCRAESAPMGDAYKPWSRVAAKNTAFDRISIQSREKRILGILGKSGHSSCEALAPNKACCRS